MVTGSQIVSMDTINMLRNKGVQTVANWYGMTEFPPPVLVAYNSDCFDLTSTKYDIKFTEEGECVINGFHTRDIFDVASGRILGRKDTANGNTWKTNI
jgi:long-subunit acyl-CoA synthetase (AMP-forming)